MSLWIEEGNMVSPELIRRYAFFAGLDYAHLVQLSKVAQERTIDEGHYVFHEGDELEFFYLILEGAVAIVLEVPDQDVKQEISGQLTGKVKTKDVTVSTVGTGDVFGWSGLIPPHTATAGARAVTSCRVVAFDCEELWQAFEQDCQFGLIMTRKGAQVIRERLRDMRIESMAHLAE
jgi:CRP/FNR family cyclic AMP-dependent transcriptional regulator